MKTKWERIAKWDRYKQRRTAKEQREAEKVSTLRRAINDALKRLEARHEVPKR